MIKNLNSNQLLLIAIATILLLLAAFSFYLLQDPSAPLPFIPAPNTASPTFSPSNPANTPAPSSTNTPTRQTSYTPFATLLTPNSEIATQIASQSQTIMPIISSSPPVLTSTSTVIPPGSTTLTPPPLPATGTTSPTATGTLSAGQYGVTGRLLKNGAPVANAVVEFEDNLASRQGFTTNGGHYWFVTLTPGTSFTLTFKQSDNPNLASAPDLTSLAMLEGTLPLGTNIINLPDLELGLNLNGMIFGLQAPADGAAFSALAINPSNPIQFNWSLYNQGGSYFVELGPNDSDQSIWSSNNVTTTNLMWNGILDNDNHISSGTYWWRVGVTKSNGNYVQITYTQPWNIIFNP